MRKKKNHVRNRFKFKKIINGLYKYLYLIHKLIYAHSIEETMKILKAWIMKSQRVNILELEKVNGMKK